MRALLTSLPREVFQEAGQKLPKILKPYLDEPVGIFESFPDEPDTSTIIKLFPEVFLPNKDPLDYAQQILEAKLKYVFVPGLAFDKSNHRLGRGRGYYDRCISKLRQSSNCPQIIGLCLKQQVLEQELPVEPHDELLDSLIAV
ncbi:MAG: hypothetical protein JKY15_08755 [Deltaproteobacteria bacterium]|nr:hypothetical protein [Deltaproteobacteria bacterium]